MEIEQYLQAGDIELRAKDIKTLLEEHNNMKQDIKRLKEEYVMLQNASDEVEEEKDKEIERLNNIIKEVRNQLDYLETYSSKEDVFEDMKRRLDRIDKIIGSDKE